MNVIYTLYVSAFKSINNYITLQIYPFLTNLNLPQTRVEIWDYYVLRCLIK